MKTYTDEQLTDFRKDLKSLNDATLDWILVQLYEPADRGLIHIIQEILWKRHSTPITAWPCYSASSSWVWATEYPDVQIEYCCPKIVNRDRVWDEANHKPVAMHTSGDEARMQCSCGKKYFVYEGAQRLTRGVPNAWRTPEGIYTCRFASSPDDRYHAPKWTPVLEYGGDCICGAHLDDPERLKLFPS